MGSLPCSDQGQNSFPSGFNVPLLLNDAEAGHKVDRYGDPLSH